MNCGPAWDILANFDNDEYSARPLPVLQTLLANYLHPRGHDRS